MDMPDANLAAGNQMWRQIGKDGGIAKLKLGKTASTLAARGRYCAASRDGCAPWALGAGSEETSR
jgi:hypothetical protein